MLKYKNFNLVNHLLLKYSSPKQQQEKEKYKDISFKIK